MVVMNKDFCIQKVNDILSEQITDIQDVSF